MRSGEEARLFFKYSDKEKRAVEVIEESDKDNEIICPFTKVKVMSSKVKVMEKTTILQIHFLFK